MTDFTQTLKDAAYVTIGLGVIGFQKAQVRRQELLTALKAQRGTLEAQAGEARTLVSALIKDLEERVEPVIENLEERLDDIEGLLPEQAREVFKQARTVAKETREQVKARFVDTKVAEQAA